GGTSVNSWGTLSAFCTICSRWSPARMDAVRGLAVVLLFGLTAYCTTPGPTPPRLPDSVIHGTLGLAVQTHCGAAESDTENAPPAEGIELAMLFRENAHGAGGIPELTSIVTSFVPLLATTRSGRASPLKSATANATGDPPAPK